MSARPSKRKKSSLMWKYFVKVGDQCQCKICNVLIAFSGNTSNMFSHMKALHPDVVDAKKSNQPKIDRFTLSSAKQEVLDRELAILLTTKCLPLNLVESPPFIRFMSKVVPGYKVPVDKTVKKKYIKPMTEQVRQKISGEAKNHKFALTCDLWSNVNQESFLGLTCHYIANDTKCNVTLECVPFNVSHNNINIREMVVKSLNSFDLDLINCAGMPRDNAFNMEKAFNEGQFKDIFNFPCACHSLNLVFNEVYKEKEPVASVVKKADAIRMLFANSRERRELLCDEQKKLNLTQQVFPSPCVTRWWSLHYVLTFLLKNHQAIANSFADKTKFKQDEILSYGVQFLATLFTLNYLGAEASNISTTMESESQPTVSLILPFLFNFAKRLDSDEKKIIGAQAVKLCKIHLSAVDSLDVQAHVDKVFTAFKESFVAFKSKYLDSKFYDTLAISTLLDPRYKSGKTFAASEKERLIANVLLLMSEESSKNCLPTDPTQGNLALEVIPDSNEESIEETGASTSALREMDQTNDEVLVTDSDVDSLDNDVDDVDYVPPMPMDEMSKLFYELDSEEDLMENELANSKRKKKYQFALFYFYQTRSCF